MTEAIVYQCPNCNGHLAFDSASGMLTCAFCGSAFDPLQIEQLYVQKQAAADSQAALESQGKQLDAHDAQTISASQDVPTRAQSVEVPDATLGVRPVDTQDPIQTYLQNAHWEHFDEDELNAINCSSCGAQLMTTQVTAATICPYCGNSTIVPGKLANVLKPHLIIPFKHDREAALSALKNYYRGKKLLPDSFKEENHLEEIQGIYVPFWLYSGKAHASIATEGRMTRTWVDPKNTYIATDRYHVFREGEMEFHHVPVDGSTKMPDGHMDSIEPFDYSGLVPFSLGYLPGYLADRYDLDMDACGGRVQRRIQTTCEKTLLDTIVGYTEVDSAPALSQFQLDDVAYALFPVWMLHTRWHGDDYLFAMNGQTGKIVGDLPIDKGKMVKTYFMWFFPLALLVALVIYFTIGFGF